MLWFAEASECCITEKQKDVLSQTNIWMSFHKYTDGCSVTDRLVNVLLQKGKRFLSQRKM